MLNKSLKFRLSATSVLWITASVVVLLWFLVVLLREHDEKHFRYILSERLNEFIAAGELMGKNDYQLSWFPLEPRFNVLNSGWYWQASQNGRVVSRSGSLGENYLPMPPTGAYSEAWFGKMIGPLGNRVYGLSRTVKLRRAKEPLTILVTGPATQVEEDVRAFSKTLVIVLLIFGIGLSFVIIVQVIFGLRPLVVLQDVLGQIRKGERKRLPESFPNEIMPIVTELNGLLDANSILHERTRARFGDLAHALKNPLTVLKNEAQTLKGETREKMLKHLTVVTDNIDHHLARAQAAGGVSFGKQTDIDSVVEDILFSVNLLNWDRHISAETYGLGNLIFHGDAQDLAEMLGNLVDNAFKWARYRVVVSGRLTNGIIEIIVEDDGPGVPEEEIEMVIQRGRRLDEMQPGNGLGLGIVNDLAELYPQGGLELGRSPMGGLSASLFLPGERTGNR